MSDRFNKTAVITTLITVVLSFSAAWGASVVSRLDQLEASTTELTKQVIELNAERKFVLQILEEMRADLKTIRDTLGPIHPR